MSLQVWLPLDEDLHNQGLNNIIMTNNGATIDNNGKIGKCYSFNGTSNVIYNRNISINCNKLSMCCWIYRTTSHTGDGYISSLNNGAGYADAAIALDSPTSTSVCFVGGGNYSLTATISPNTWNHIAVTYDGTKVIGYLNGQKVGEVTNTQILTRTQLAIGCRCNSTNSFIYYFPGKLNDFRLYDHCLSQKEIEEISKGLVLHYKLDSIINNKIYDCSGYQNNGTPTNISFSFSSIRYSNCAVFNGSSSYIAAGRGAMVKDAISVCCWAYMTNWANYTARLLSCTESGGWNFEPSSGKLNFAMGTGASSNTYKGAVSTRTLASLSSGWHYFVGTYDGFSTKIYIDGNLEGTNTAYTTKTPIYYSSSNGIFIGAEAAGTTTTPATTANTKFNGNMSDVRIYATALSIDAIKELYNTSVTIDNKGNIYARELVEE